MMEVSLMSALLNQISSHCTLSTGSKLCCSLIKVVREGVRRKLQLSEGHLYIIDFNVPISRESRVCHKELKDLVSL